MVSFLLSAVERQRYREKGKPYLDGLAQHVYAYPKNYRERRVVLE